MNLDKLTSGDVPTAVLAAGGVLLLVIAFKFVKAGSKLLLLIVALGLLAGAVWWHLHKR